MCAAVGGKEDDKVKKDEASSNMWPWSKVLGDVLSVCIKALLVQGCQVCVTYEGHLAKTLNFFIYCLCQDQVRPVCRKIYHNISKVV